ncbi:MAG: COR domain-containing protein [Cyanobacteria bacterium P01_E01_bin.6]
MTRDDLLALIDQAAAEGWTELDLAGENVTELPPKISKLTQLTVLILGKYDETKGRLGNPLRALPPEIGQLTSLQSLSLSYTQLSALPSKIGQLTNLQSLSLSYTQLSALPSEIGQLTSLQSLSLSYTQLSALPSEIGQLTSLQSLVLSDNPLSALPSEIGQLTNLQSLVLSTNPLSALPSEIGQLTNLQSLVLSTNQLSALPSEIGQLTSLQSLVLSANLLSALPSEIGQLTSLQSLDLSANELSALPSEIGQLTSLQSLDLSANQLSALPSEIGQLTSLQSLDLSANELSALPPEIGQLTSLQSLYLSYNELNALPPEIGQLTSLQLLYLRANPLEDPPPEIVTEGTQRTLNYMRQKLEQGTEPLYEAKFLIVGEGGAGKTSLSNKLIDPSYELDAQQVSTDGIDVIPWSFKLRDGASFQANIWDFGGQEIYHATHQFFLTKRSLYALVVDTRKDNTDLHYWLSVINLFSDGSPILIIKNEKDDRPCEVNERQLRGEFLNLKEALATNLKTNRGLDGIQQAIQQSMTTLPHVGMDWPKKWAEIRRSLEEEAKTSNYISLSAYTALCKQHSLTQRTDQLQLSDYLHDLGVCLHFQDDPLLKKTIILKPEWGTDAVYKVLDTQAIIANLGRFTRDQLDTIWSDDTYVDMQGELLQLMQNFKLCYEIPGLPQHYIAPQLLSSDAPDYPWDDQANLIFRYRYDFMPKGILSRLIVEMHRFIENQTLVWKTGAVFTNETARAEVIEHYPKKEIRIRVSGSDQKRWLSVVTYELEKIHSTYERLQYKALIPCNCSECKGSQTPQTYPYEGLQRRLQKQKYIMECEQSFEKVDVRRLLDDILSRAMSYEAMNSLDDRGSEAREKVIIQQGLPTIPNIDPIIRNTPLQLYPQPNSQSTAKEVFISYAWRGESEDIVNQIDDTFKPLDITLIRDKRDLGFKDRIKAFMEQIGQGKAVIVVISDRYLKSENCMFELVEIAKNEGFYDRIFPIILDDADIYKPAKRIRYIQHWEHEIADLDEAMKTVNAANLQGFRESIDLYTNIRNTIADLTETLKDMNALTPERHTESRFKELIEAITQRLESDI